MAIVDVSDQSFATDVEAKGQGTVLVDFWASWCNPCRMLAPILEDVDKEIGDKVTIAKLDVDSNPETAGRYGIMSIPTMMVFKDGEMVSKMQGVQPKEQLVQWLEQYV